MNRQTPKICVFCFLTSLLYTTCFPFLSMVDSTELWPHWLILIENYTRKRLIKVLIVPKNRLKRKKHSGSMKAKCIYARSSYRNVYFGYYFKTLFCTLRVQIFLLCSWRLFPFLDDVSNVCLCLNFGQTIKDCLRRDNLVEILICSQFLLLYLIPQIASHIKFSLFLRQSSMQ